MAVAITVKEVMDTNVMSVESGATVAEAVHAMIKAKVWSLLVEKRGVPQGVVTERDVIRRCVDKGLSPGELKVEEVMSSPLITVGPATSIRAAMNLMIDKDVRRLYIVVGGKVIGRVTLTRLFQRNFDLMVSLSGLTGSL